VDSNKTLPECSRNLAGEVSACFFRLMSIAIRMLRDLQHSIPLHWRVPTHPVPMLSDRWLNSYAYFCTRVPRASSFKLLATECYRHADTSRPILFDSPRQADSNDTLPDSGGHLPGEVSTIFFRPTSIAMQTLRHLSHSIPLGEWTPMRPFPTLADICLLRYLPFSPC